MRVKLFTLFFIVLVNFRAVPGEREIDGRERNKALSAVKYRYEISPNGWYTWETAREYCKNRGGDLAFNGLETISKRQDIICGDLQRCDRSTRLLFWGLRKRQGTVETWEYADGSLAQDNDIHWSYSHQKIDGDECARINVGNGLYRFKVTSVPCDSDIYGAKYYHAFCQFAI